MPGRSMRLLAVGLLLAALAATVTVLHQRQLGGDLYGLDGRDDCPHNCECTAGTCTSCTNGWYLTPFPICVDNCSEYSMTISASNPARCECEQGYGGPSCLTPCPANCDRCHTNAAATCLQCSDGFIPYTSNGTCVTVAECESFGAATRVSANTCVDVNECTTKEAPCNDHGTCINNVPKAPEDSPYFCSPCDNGWVGPYCNVDLHCDGNPCGVGGTCTNLGDGYNCTCHPAYSGPDCQDFTDFCEKYYNETGEPRCAGNSTCVPGINGYTCNCPDYLDGQHCTIQVNCDEGVSCRNGGTCFSLPNDNFECACPSGWGGPICETDLDECDPDPCTNGGTCTTQAGFDSFTCLCPQGLGGTVCQFIDSCADNLCQNGATCVVTSNTSYDCDCTDGWRGDLCANVSCPDGYTGPNCDIMEVCNPSPCQHGGTCAAGNAEASNYTCSCTDEYIGDNCECMFRGIRAREEKRERDKGVGEGEERRAICSPCPEGYEGEQCEINSAGTDQSTSNDDDVFQGPVLYGVLAAAVLLAIAAIWIICCRCKGKPSSTREHRMPKSITSFSNPGYRGPRPSEGAGMYENMSAHAPIFNPGYEEGPAPADGAPRTVTSNGAYRAASAVGGAGKDQYSQAGMRPQPAPGHVDGYLDVTTPGQAQAAGMPVAAAVNHDDGYLDVQESGAGGAAGAGAAAMGQPQATQDDGYLDVEQPGSGMPASSAAALADASQDDGYLDVEHPGSGLPPPTSAPPAPVTAADETDGYLDFDEGAAPTSSVIPQPGASAEETDGYLDFDEGATAAAPAVPQLGGAAEETDGYLDFDESAAPAAAPPAAQGEEEGDGYLDVEHPQ
ncbi:uncharacterized protein MONBRDRAFT_32603 [Monosiga brevicollis MX1]|uniref:EGF-like domain-containing protein n=1 Tax=Monosiga brevicollis TaxID=81824 RepID=A9V0L5_MONBE|nr:uncharacterized protein MONBRDRAFT_32603 [Monosiga brevicollis MX1]EDQ89172.1 predicted protein [Monosiga brevicollis MX1]|eukprot:XP_001746277.1 hypothetical protein [Monosiga brevicollis MX1]